MILDHRQLGAGKALDALQDLHFFRRAKRQRDSLGPRAGGATDAMHIALAIVGQIVVDHVRNSLHIDAAGNDVGGDQNLDPPAIELRQRPLARALRLVGVNGVGADALVGQLLHHPVGPALGARKDQRPPHVVALEYTGQQIALTRLLDEEHPLLDPLRYRRRRRHLRPHRLVQHIGGQRSDLLGQRRRKEQGLPFFGQGPNDAAHVVDKAHIEHAVGLVEDQDFDLVELDVALAHQIEQAARGRDQDIGFFAQRTNLRAGRHPAQNHRPLERQIAAVGAKTLLDLQRQLARRRQHQGANLPPALALAEQLQNRQRERRGLARPRLCGGQEILALQHHRDSLLLNGRRLLVARLIQRAQQLFF